MVQSRDYLEMSFRSIECFTNDGRIDAYELGKILDIAEKDGEVDQDEIRVLRGIISRIRPDEVDEPLRQKLEEISLKINA